jgi:hypothetical protein
MPRVGSGPERGGSRGVAVLGRREAEARLFHLPCSPNTPRPRPTPTLAPPGQLHRRGPGRPFPAGRLHGPHRPPPLLHTRQGRRGAAVQGARAVGGARGAAGAPDAAISLQHSSRDCPLPRRARRLGPYLLSPPPPIHPPPSYKFSPYLGAPQPPRDILLFHRGRMGLTDFPAYSRGVRQRVRGGAPRAAAPRLQASPTPRARCVLSAGCACRLPCSLPYSTRPVPVPAAPQIARAAKAGNWSGKFSIHVGGYDDIEGEYGQLLARSTFCLVAAGGGRLLGGRDGELGCWRRGWKARRPGGALPPLARPDPPPPPPRRRCTRRRRLERAL